MTCDSCADTQTVHFEGRDMPCPRCCPDDARDAAQVFDPPALIEAPVPEPPDCELDDCLYSELEER